MRKLLLLTMVLLSAVSTYAQAFSADKVYTIVNNNDANCYMQDNGTGVVATGNKNDNSYWKFVSTGKDDCYYIQNATTEKYIQGYTASEQEVATGDAGVEYYVKADAEGSYAGKFRMSSTANSPYDFSDGTLGLNWKNNNTVQSFASVAAGNPRSAWVVTEATMPEPEPEPEPVVLSSPYTGSVVGEGEFYLYNVSTGLWIQNIDANNRRADNNWNTGAGMGTAGFDFTLTAVDGGYNLDPKENPRKFGWGYGDGGVMYLDGNIGGNTHWDFTPANGISNGYKISIDGHVLGVEVAGNKSFLINNATENDVWQLVTKSERLEKMQTIVTEGNPYDLSFLLGDWNFATNNLRRDQWKETQDGGNNDGYPRGKSWNSSHLVWNTNSYSWTQTVTDLPDGLYQLSVQGMYRDGNRSEVGAKAASGQTNLIAKYFIGGVEASLMSILAQAQTTQGDGFETAIENTNPQLYAPDNATNWSIVWALHPDKYWNEPIKVNVRGGSVELGVRKTSRIAGDWIAMNEFKLEYVGPLDLTEYKNALQAAITAAEAFNGITTEKLSSELETALSQAKAAQESSDIDVIEAATDALNKARLAAEAVNAANLIATIPLAEAEGIDVTAAKEVAKNATEADAVNNALNDLCTARKLNAVDKQPNIFTGSAPKDGGQYYLYNVGAQRYLTGGVNYGTHAAVNYAAQIATFHANGNGFRIHTNIRNGSDALNFNGYIDCGGDGDTWFLKEVKDGVYTIAQNEAGEGKCYLGYNGPARGNWWQVDSDCEGADNLNNQWIFVSKAERDALLAEATAKNPVDATYYIHAAGFDHWLVPSTLAWPNTKWTWNNGGDGGWEPDFVYEVWHAGETEMSQTIEGLPAGKYIATVQGYYRDGDNTGGSNYQGDRQEAYFFAGDAQVLLPNIAAEANKYPSLGNAAGGHGVVPDSREEAANYFEAGLYKVSVETTVGPDGKLKIGAYKSGNVANDWMVLDNFRLTCIGLTDYVTVGEALYATYVAPFDVDFTGAQVKAFAAKINNEKGYSFVDLTDVTTVPAGTAVVVKADAAGTYAVAKTTGVEEIQGNELVAATEEVTADGTQYILAKQDAGVGFAQATPSTKIAAGKGYLVITGEAGVKAFYPFFGEDATAIANVNVNDNDNQAVIYNVAGQRVSKMQKGINIVNGKKVLK